MQGHCAVLPDHRVEDRGAYRADEVTHQIAPQKSVAKVERAKARGARRIDPWRVVQSRKDRGILPGSESERERRY